MRESQETANVARLQRVETQPLAGCYPRSDLGSRGTRPGHQAGLGGLGNYASAARGAFTGFIIKHS